MPSFELTLGPSFSVVSRRSLRGVVMSKAGEDMTPSKGAARVLYQADFGEGEAVRRSVKSERGGPFAQKGTSYHLEVLSHQS